MVLWLKSKMALLLRGSYIVKRAEGGTLVRPGSPRFFFVSKNVSVSTPSSHDLTVRKSQYKVQICDNSLQLHRLIQTAHLTTTMYTSKRQNYNCFSSLGSDHS